METKWGLRIDRRVPAANETVEMWRHYAAALYGQLIGLCGALMAMLTLTRGVTLQPYVPLMLLAGGIALLGAGLTVTVLSVVRLERMVRAARVRATPT